MQILIVEDDMSIALDLEMLIDELGYELLGLVDNAEAALAIALEKLPDLILMDISIKGKYSGLEVAEKIKHLPIVILFITSHQTEEVFQRAKLTNFAGYLTKPITKVSIIGAIEMANKFLNNSNSPSSPTAYPTTKLSDNNSPYEKEDIFITRLKRYLLNNLNNSDLSVEEIAENMGISRMQLHRKIKALTNYSTSKYIQHIRLENALKLLEEQKLNISEIAYRVGFRNPNHFSRLFKEKYGDTPSNLMKK